MKFNFKKFDTYQINCTYYSALGEDDNKYLISRAVQFFTPGIPQVYYVGLFAGKNDFELYHKTEQHRDINRHYYSLDEIKTEFERPVVQKMNRLMKFRNTHPAFDGQFMLLNSDDHPCISDGKRMLNTQNFMLILKLLNGISFILKMERKRCLFKKKQKRG